MDPMADKLTYKYSQKQPELIGRVGPWIFLYIFFTKKMLRFQSEDPVVQRNMTLLNKLFKSKVRPYMTIFNKLFKSKVRPYMTPNN